MDMTEPWHLSGLAETNLSTRTKSNCGSWESSDRRCFKLIKLLLLTLRVYAASDQDSFCSALHVFTIKICLSRVLRQSWTTLKPTWPQITLLWSPAWPSEDIQCPFPWVKAQRDALMFYIHTQVYVPGSPLRPRLPRFPGGPAETKTNTMNCTW